MNLYEYLNVVIFFSKKKKEKEKVCNNDLNVFSVCKVLKLIVSLQIRDSVVSVSG